MEPARRGFSMRRATKCGCFGCPTVISDLPGLSSFLLRNPDDHSHPNRERELAGHCWTGVRELLPVLQGLRYLRAREARRHMVLALQAWQGLRDPRRAANPMHRVQLP